MAGRIIFVVTSVAIFIAISASLCGAQMRGGSRGGGRGLGSPSGRASFSHHRNNVPRGYFAGDTAFLWDDYPFGEATPEYTPPYLVMQAPAAAEAAPPRVASLLIELQGDRYVRYGGMARSEDADVRSREVAVLAGKSGSEISSSLAGPNLTATVLVYRDGRREEVADYVIVGRTMYAHPSGNNDGQGQYGLADIQLSALDIAATTAANRANGVSFVLPASANQVVTRP
jgi:hypothetical protein